MLNIRSKTPYMAEEQVMTIPAFISKLFYYRTAVHFLHLKVSGTGAYAAHKALNDLYDTLLEIADELAETSQHEELLDFCHEKVCSSDVNMEILMDMCNFVETNRYILPHSYQQNIIDTLTAELARTKYKVKFLL
jgi:hypothetical protein